MVTGLAGTGGPGVVLAGEAGVGKSRLAREVVDWAGGAGWAVDWMGATYELRAIPFGAFAQLLGSSNGGNPLVEVADVVRRRRSDSRMGRLLLVVDDGQWLDDGSKAMVQHLVRTHEAFVIVTLRSGADGGSWLVPLWKDGQLERIDLQALSRLETEALTTEVLGGPVDGATMARLWDASRGNVLYLREVLFGAVEEGALVVEAGVWHARDQLVVVGARLREVVEARLGRLSDTEQRVADLLAIGDQLGLPMLVALANDAAVGALEERGVIVVEQSGRRTQVRMAHPLHGEIRRAGMPVIRRLATMRSLAEAVEGYGARRTGDRVQLAMWRLEAGGGSAELFLDAAGRIETAVEVSMRASLTGDASHRVDEAAVRLAGASANVMALVQRLAQAGLDAGGGLEAALRALYSATMMADGESAAKIIEVLNTLTADDLSKAMAAFHHSMAIFLISDDLERADQLLVRTLAEVRDPAARRQLTLNRARLLTLASCEMQGADLVDELLADEDLELGVRGEALALEAAVLAAQGRCADSLAASQAAVEALGALPPGTQQMGVGAVIANQGYAYCWAGRLPELSQLSDEISAAAFATASAEERGEITMMRGEYNALTGKLAAAEQDFGQAVIYFRLQDGFRTVGWAWAGLAYARLLRGDLGRAGEALAAMDAARTPFEWLRPYLVRARAWRRAVAGNTARASELLLNAAEVEQRAGRLPLAALLLHEVSRLGFPRETVAALRRLKSDGYDGVWLDSMIDFAEAAIAGDGKTLDAVSRRFEELHCVLWAAEASVLAASAHRTGGLVARAAAAVARGSLLAGRCEQARTPILRQASEPPLLTRREREIARLAATGLSDQHIAERLVVSVRTVHTHLHNIYGKLGATGRHDLASLLGSTESQ